MIARVLPDLPAVDRVFDYELPDGEPLPVGTIVRVDLHGRRVRGWVVGLAGEPEPGVVPKPIAKVSSAGPPPEVVDLAAWAAHRWAGRRAHLLRTASPPANVPTGDGYQSDRPTTIPRTGVAGVGVVVRRVGPLRDRLPIVLDALAAGPCIVVVPEVDTAARLAARLRREGHRVALLAGDVTARDWQLAATGGATVVGTRVAVWAPIPDAALAGIVVLDEHDESLQSEQAPTWHARDVAVERARRAGVPCTLVSPVPTLHALAAADDVVVDHGGWPRVEVADRRRDDTPGLFSRRLVGLARAAPTAVCVLNRLGRSRLLVCAACDTTAACDRCGAAVHQPDDATLRCATCGTERATVCLECGGGRFKNLRMGVTRAREELGALVGPHVVVDTEAVLHRLPAASTALVCILDADQELLAPRFRAAEQALVLFARAARAVAPGGRLLIQTRLPEHPAVRAAVLGDPGRFVAAEQPRRAALGYPPDGGMAVVSGQAAAAWAEAAAAAGIDGVHGPSADGRWLVRAADPDDLADRLAAVPRPPGRLRIEVDPPRA